MIKYAYIPIGVENTNSSYNQRFNFIICNIQVSELKVRKKAIIIKLGKKSFKGKWSRPIQETAL